jgi:hypothetical protein
VRRPAVQKIGLRTIRPYAMNAMRRRGTPRKMMVVISPYLACTQTPDRQDRGGHHRERRMPVEGGGTISPTVQTSSTMPRAIQASTPSFRPG